MPAQVVAIAASTGGPAALHRILTTLPEDFPVPILVVQHMSRGFGAGFADWLDMASPLRVKLAKEGEALLPGTVYLGVDDHHLGVSPAPQGPALGRPRGRVASGPRAPCSSSPSPRPLGAARWR